MATETILSAKAFFRKWRGLNLGDPIVTDGVLRFYWALYLIETCRQLLYKPSTFNSLFFPAIWTAIETILLFLGIQVAVRLTNLACKVIFKNPHRFSVTASTSALIVTWILTDILVVISIVFNNIIFTDSDSPDPLNFLYATALDFVRLTWLKGYIDDVTVYDTFAINTTYSLMAVLLFLGIALWLRTSGKPRRKLKPSRVCWPAVWVVFSLISTAHAALMLWQG
ncbi:hypothetical protein DBIPINDM_004926 [Mesorhizobium sp. AR02]|uniref:hypothetical protein n=1 Tax=Mesorhizobium sp. AR02 TaxID=2865837 RepID=UPI00215EC880|nr:hypothetical protein [Mesorhizobium sp. AR02]UVK51634.1 hypothetical protein DBIPINDM_004926 [Mesorhizobium sp. AR02]